MPSKRPAPFKAQYDAGRLTLNTCDHATGGERPCTVALTVSGICLYHGTSWDRQADLVAAEHDAVRKGAVYRARAEAESVDSKVAVRKQHRSRWLLAFGLLLGLVGWFGWTGAESQEDAGCRDVRVSGRSAKQDAIAVGIPLTAELGNESSRVWPATEQGIKDAYARKRRLAGQSAALMLAHPMCFTEAEVSEA
ncbi:hypothetical protein ACFXKJ_41035, partial [Kitasatospora indigofera]|uniref:hypothetical protein n=2 Tax=Streptomycetaceae TaxID=2062 RepID=UPI0036956951